MMCDLGSPCFNSRVQSAGKKTTRNLRINHGNVKIKKLGIGLIYAYF